MHCTERQKRKTSKSLPPAIGFHSISSYASNPEPSLPTRGCLAASSNSSFRRRAGKGGKRKERGPRCSRQDHHPRGSVIFCGSMCGPPSVVVVVVVGRSSVVMVVRRGTASEGVGRPHVDDLRGCRSRARRHSPRRCVVLVLRRAAQTASRVASASFSWGSSESRRRLERASRACGPFGP